MFVTTLQQLTTNHMSPRANGIAKLRSSGADLGGGGVLWGLKPPPLLGYHLLQKSLCLHYHQPLSSLYVLDSVCQTPL